MKTRHKYLILIGIFIISSNVLAQEKEAQTTATDITITKISDLKNDTTTHIQGEVIKILDEDTFRIKDDSDAIKVYTGWKNTNLVKEGQKVRVKGKLDPGLIKEFYASEISIENGKVIKLESD